MDLAIYRGGSVAFFVKATDDSRVSEKLMGESIVSVSIISSTVVAFQINDYIIDSNKKYYLNSLPSVTKNSTREFSYSCEFSASLYNLNKTKLLSITGERDHNLNGQIVDFLTLIVSNLQRNDTNWAVGSYITNTDYKNISFSGENCLAALSKLAKEYETEFYIDDSQTIKTINLKEKGTVQAITLQYGSNGGLYKIDRKNVDSSGIITRLYAFGSDRNIPSSYRSGAKRLKFSDTSALEANVYDYGINEADVVFDDIFPTRTGTITFMQEDVSDTGIDFDLNSQMLPGISPKIHFQTGMLAGYEFEIVKDSWNNTYKSFRIVPYTDTNGRILPSGDYFPVTGDTYKFIDIDLPQSYITAAETALQAKAQEYLNKNSTPRVAYSVIADPIFFKAANISLSAGDTVTIYDPNLGVNKQIRVTEISRKLSDQYNYDKIVLSDTLYESVGLAQARFNNSIIQKVNTERLGNINVMQHKWADRFKAQQALDEITNGVH
jgi:hypothetical protein